MSPDPQRPLAGRTIIVSGAARGLGQVMAGAVLSAGANVVAVARSAPPDILTADPSARQRLLAVAADVATADGCERVADAALARFGILHGLVNNAALGMDVVLGPDPAALPRFWEIDPAIWSRLIATNVTGPFLMSRAVLPVLLAARWGRIVNVSTGRTTMTKAGYSPYGPSKAALEAATAIWAKELLGSGVTINALLPGGPCRTRMISQREGIPPARLLDPQIMATPLLWLLSAEADAFNGRRLVAAQWDATLPAVAAAGRASRPISFD